MSVSVKVENLSKAYQLGEIGTGTISRDLERWVAKKRGKEDPFLRIGEVNDRSVKGESDIVWSLKDINFEIERGDAVGIIGKNGAGKSTLLKILSRVTSPTKGLVKLKGRIASLLEVGTGFHPELTGKENIYLNGAILGMRRKEIARKFDEIVDFSGVERYIDTPVKRYSSGMYVRLAFAVAAHLDAEILIVDEVLAVGDADFQKKCLGKMNDVSRGEGKTVLFVSHNMVVLKQLCSKSLLLVNGINTGYDSTDIIIDRYLNEGKEPHIFTQKDKDIYITGFRYYSAAGESIRPDTKSIFEFTIFCSRKLQKVHVAFGINDKYGNRLFTPFTKYNDEMLELAEGENTVLCEIEKLFLKPGIYYLHLYVGDGHERFDYISEGLTMEVAPVPFYSSFMPDESHGYFLINQKWILK